MSLPFSPFLASWCASLFCLHTLSTGTALSLQTPSPLCTPLALYCCISSGSNHVTLNLGQLFIPKTPLELGDVQLSLQFCRPALLFEWVSSHPSTDKGLIRLPSSVPLNLTRLLQLRHVLLQPHSVFFYLQSSPTTDPVLLLNWTSPPSPDYRSHPSMLQSPPLYPDLPPASPGPSAPSGLPSHIQVSIT
jgi:hypothetical protein